MKRVWCLLLLALCTLACVKEPDAPVVLVPSAAATETPAASDTPTPNPTHSPSPVPTEAPTATPTAEPTRSPEQKLTEYIEGMSVEEKIGQICMFGFSGTNTVSSEFKAILKEYRVGSVILYGQNMVRTASDGGFGQCRRLSDSVREANASEIPLLISTDVEGGSVTRFRWSKKLYSARTLGKKKRTDLAYEQFRTIAAGLLSAGINVDLAPCLDVTEHPDGHFLGKRIISADADLAARIGAACIEGLHDGGVLSIVKHFPGHGATATDSHDATPVVKKSLESLSDYELIPFAAAVNEADGVMVAHISYPNIDAEHIASQSEVVITDLLRKELGFQGVVMSDDFRMAGLRSQTSLKNAAVRFILAGGDLILCGANHSYQKQILEGLYAAAEDGTISEARLNESVYRILSAKQRVTGWDPFTDED